MGQDTKRFMRMLVFFDLPVVTKTEKRAYTVFRRFLLNDRSSEGRVYPALSSSVVSFIRN